MSPKTLRDELAMAALTGMLAYSHVNPGKENVARDAYAYADACLKIREEGRGVGLPTTSKERE